jgi:hypothetical protein
MKIITDLYTGNNTDIIRQICIKPSDNHITRKRRFGSDVTAIHICMHSGICSAATNNVFTHTKQLFNTVLKCLLNRRCILLNLPSAVGSAEIFNCKK